MKNIMEKMKERRCFLKEAEKDTRGFSLVEMIIVLVIMVIMIAMVGPKVTRYINSAHTTSASSTASTIYTAATSYAVELMAEGKTLNGGRMQLNGTFAPKTGTIANWTAADMKEFLSADLDASDNVTIIVDENGAISQIGYQPGGSGDWYIAPGGTTSATEPTAP